MLRNLTKNRELLKDMSAFWSFILISVFLHFKILLNFSTSTFNFEDNVGYAYKITEIGRSLLFSIQNLTNPFIDIHSKGIQIVSPVQEVTGGMLVATTSISALAVINLFILLNYLLANIFSYKLAYYLTKNRLVSILCGVSFGFSSLAIYITWFNLTGFCFLPAVLYYALKYKDAPTKINFVALFLTSLILSATSTYYIMFPYIIWLSISVLYFKETKYILRIFLIIFLSSIFAGILYIIPIALSNGSDSLNTTITGAELEKTGNEITGLVHSNTFSPLGAEPYKGLLPDLPYFRYSYYIGFTTLLLLIASIYTGWRNKTKTYILGLLLMIFGTVLFCGDYLVVFGYDTLIKMPMYYIHELKYGIIIRKSVYFFHIFILGAALLLTDYLKDTKNKKIMLCIISLVVLENVFLFVRPTHDIPDRSNIYSKIDGNFIGLPNTNFSSNTFAFDASRYNVKNDFKYGDIFAIEAMEKINNANNTPNPPTGMIEYLNRPVYFGGNCYLDLLIYSLDERSGVNCDIAKDFSEIELLDIKYVVLYKNFITDFWYKCDSSCYYYLDVFEIIISNKAFIKIYEDEEGVVYKIDYSLIK